MRFKKSKIQFIRPVLPSAASLINDYQKIQKNNWYTNFGPYEKRFCEGIEQYIGNGVAAVSVSSATTGLIIAAKSLFGTTSQKNEVIMPSFTFSAGAEALIMLGFKPIFMDIEKVTWQLDLSYAEAYLRKNNRRVAGILFCNTFGVGAPEIKKWEKLAQQFAIPLVIDSAAGFGSRYVDGEILGGRGDCEVFSFHATKTLSIGEGGVITCRNKKLSHMLKQMSNFGFNAKREVVNIGINGKMQEINAAIGIRQLKKINKTIQQRHNKLTYYKKLLEPQGYSFQKNDINSALAFASVIAPTKERANSFFNNLNQACIEARRYYNPPLHQQPKIMQHAMVASTVANTEDIAGRIISLPIHNALSRKGIDKICSFAV